MTDVAARYDELRPLMFSIAYRMLGRVSEAEDVVQDAWLRMQTDDSPIRSAEAYASTVTTRLAIDHLRSARVRREAYVGPWLPEPLLTTPTDADPAVRAETVDTLSTAFLVLLERLSPVERAVFLLREAFGYDYDRIAAIVEKSETNCRQIFARARSRVDERRPRFEASRAKRDELARRFFAACDRGDLAGLERLLAAEVVFYGDGGGKARAVRRPVHGRVQVLRFMGTLLRQGAAQGGWIEPVEVNGQPGARLMGGDGRLVGVLTIDIADGQIQAMRNVVNPDKLRHLGSPLADSPAE